MKNLEILVKFLTYVGANSNDPADATKITNRVQEEDIDEMSRTCISIPDATSDLSISLPDPNSDYLLIFIDREVTIKLNGGSEVFTLTPSANGVKTFAFFWKGDVTGLQISNASGNAANVDVLAVNS